jgi:hypothetical protein
MTDQDTTDWRLQGQERYLSGAKLLRKTYRGAQTRPGEDHDHCEFCFAKFTVENLPKFA